MSRGDYDSYKQLDVLLGEGDSEYVVTVSENTVVRAACPLDTKSHDMLRITKGDNCTFSPHLVLISTSDRQPCIGPATQDGMSFGRFSLADCDLKHIQIDGVIVECVTHDNNDNFSLGSYGRNNAPSVTISSGDLLCPELTHRGGRHMINNIQYYSGSTKLTGYATYYYTDDPTFDAWSVCSKEQIALRGRVLDKCPALVEFLTPEVCEFKLSRLLEVIDFVTADKLSKYLDVNTVNSPDYFMTLRTCLILGMPEELASTKEFLFEVSKADFLIEKYYGGQSEYDGYDLAKAIAVAMYGILLMSKGTDAETLSYEIAYEMIPSYYFSFEKGVPHRVNAISFIRETIDKCYDLKEIDYLTDKRMADVICLAVESAKRESTGLTNLL